MTARYNLPLAIDAGFWVEMVSELLVDTNDAINNLAHRHNSFFLIDQGIGQQAIASIESYITGKSIGDSGCMMIVPGGEHLKNGFDPVIKVLEQFEHNRLDRKGKVFLIGGGSLLDMGAFATTMYHRGLDYVRIPTTLLAQVDAGIGTKCGINFWGQKNCLGFFKPPQAVLVDTGFLTTLSERHLRSGLAEALKIAVIKHAELFALLETSHSNIFNRNFDCDNARYIIWETICAHLDQIMLDPYENKTARPLDFGHEWGHRLEILSAHELSHGEAIAIGMALDSHIALQKGLITDTELGRIINLIAQLGLPVVHCLATVDNLWPGLENFRRHLGGELTITLVSDYIGHKQDVHEISRCELARAIEYLQNWR